MQQDVEEIKIDDKIISKIESSDEFDKLLESIMEDYDVEEIGEVKGYTSMNEDTDKVAVFPLLGTKATVSSIVFHISDGNILKGVGSIEFHNSEPPRIHKYEYVHEDEEFFTVPDERVLNEENRFDGEVHVVEYTVNQGS